MKRFTKIMALLMVTALIMGIAAISASAAGYTPIPGTSTAFTKDVVVDADANIPHETFSFTIESGTAQVATASTVAIHAGPNPTAVSVGTASFTSNHATTPGTPGDSTATDKKYAEETVTINFSGVTFNEPGIYRYLLKETAGTTTGMTYDNRILSLDVYVIDNNGTLQVTEHVLHEGQGTISSNSTSGSDGTDVKVNGFINTSASHQIEFGKEVTGNQGSKDKYFAVKIQLNPTNGYVINDASTFPVIMTSAEMHPTPSAATNPTPLSLWLRKTPLIISLAASSRAVTHSISRTVSILRSRDFPTALHTLLPRLPRIINRSTESLPKFPEKLMMKIILLTILIRLPAHCRMISRPVLPTTSKALSPQAFC